MAFPGLFHQFRKRALTAVADTCPTSSSLMQDPNQAVVGCKTTAQLFSFAPLSAGENNPLFLMPIKLHLLNAFLGPDCFKPTIVASPARPRTTTPCRYRARHHRLQQRFVHHLGHRQPGGRLRERHRVHQRSARGPLQLQHHGRRHDQRGQRGDQRPASGTVSGGVGPVDDSFQGGQATFVN